MDLIKRPEKFINDLFFRDWYDFMWNNFFDDLDNRQLIAKKYEDEDCITIKAEVPGLDEKDINISYDNGVVTIQAKWEDKDGKSIRKTKTKNTFVINDDVDVDKADAKLENGVLTLVFPKKESAKPKLIPIKAKG